MMAEPLHGADKVNGDLEVGYDEHFEQRWIVAQNIGLVVMVLFLMACISGFLGRGPFSHRTTVTPDQSLNVDYEPVAREGTPTQITLRVSNASTMPMPVAIFLSGTIIEPLGLARTLPPTDVSMVGSSGVIMRFAIAPLQDNAMIRLSTTPVSPGIVHLRAWTGADAGTVPPDPTHIAHWTQVVLP